MKLPLSSYDFKKVLLLDKFLKLARMTRNLIELPHVAVNPPHLKPA